MSRSTVIGRVLRWSALGLCLLLGALVALVLYNVYSFDTETPPARYGQTESVLYAPEGPPRPLLVGLGGSEGGNAWTHSFHAARRQALLDQGFALLALGYFGGEQSPAQLDRISLDAVMAAIEAAQRDPRVSDTCVVLIGGSKGAELAMNLGAYFDIDAVLALAPGDTVFAGHTEAFTTSSWTLADRQLPFAPVPWSATWDLIAGDIHAVMQRSLAEPEAEAARIPVERLRGPLLLLTADQDEMWPSSWMAKRVVTRLQAAGHPYAVKHVEIHGGHVDVLDHFDQVHEFLRQEVLTLEDCAAPENASDQFPAPAPVEAGDGAGDQGEK